jgi:PAS domain-containing protein
MSLRLEAFDLLATMVAVVRPSGECLFANAKLEDPLGVSRKTLLRGNLLEWMVEPGPLRSTLAATAANVVATGRYERHEIHAMLRDFWSEDVVEDAIAQWLGNGVMTAIEVIVIRDGGT